MRSPALYGAYLGILGRELVPALGCTEPIAVAFAAARARDVLGRIPERIEISCSANIVKNVKSVIVPNTGGLRGVDAAAIAGVLGGDASRGLQVLESVDARQFPEIRRLLDSGLCSTALAEGVEGLYIAASVYAGGESAEVVLRDSHTGIVLVRKNGATLFGEGAASDPATPAAAGMGVPAAAPGGRSDYALLSIRDIVDFADEVALGDIRDIIGAQIEMNGAISDEGLAHHYGADVGKTLLKSFGNDVRTRAKARAAAGSDARMGGCSLPVIINSGSGNQGMTVSLPVIEYAKELRTGEEKLMRALVVSNLTAIHQKEYIGKLSAYCGAVSAAVGSGAGITYLAGGGYAEVARTVTNTIATIGGMVCDGAKASCAAKIASAVDTAIMAHHIGAEGGIFRSGEGLVGEDVEETIRNFGLMGSVGMKPTDVEIIKLMLGR